MGPTPGDDGDVLSVVRELSAAREQLGSSISTETCNGYGYNAESRVDACAGFGDLSSIGRVLGAGYGGKLGTDRLVSAYVRSDESSQNECIEELSASRTLPCFREGPVLTVDDH